MKLKNVIKIIAALALLLVWVFGLVMPQYSLLFDAALRDKHAALRDTPGERIILVGDSSLAFGMESGLIEQAFGMPVINLGLHGSLGLAMNLDIVRSHAHEGDIVILLPANYRYCADDITDPVVAWLSTENDLGLLLDFAPRHFGQMLGAFPTYFKRALYCWLTGSGNQPPTSEVYSRAAFNEYGDVAYDRPANVMKDGLIKESVFYVDRENPNYNADLVEYINAFASFAQRRGVTFLQAASPIYDRSMICTVADVADYQAELEGVIDSPFISDFREYIFSEEYFYDTNNHMTTNGAHERTLLLIADLEGWLAG